MENLMRVAGILLITGAVTLWSAIVAAIVYYLRTRSLPVKPWVRNDADEYLKSIAGNPRGWVGINLSLSSGIVLTAFGFVALSTLLARAGESLFSAFGLVSFLLGTALWLILFTFNLSFVAWAANETKMRNVVPAATEGLLRWTQEVTVNVYMVFAYLSLAFYGIAILNVGLLPDWIGWASLLVGLLGSLSVMTRGASFAIPLLIHFVPFVIGIMLLLKV